MKKLKYQYHQAIEENVNDCFYFWKRYPNIKSFYFKHFSNKQERSFYCLHSIEYKDYSLKIRVARGAGLPHVWDEFPTYVYKVAKSWKHNSKRSHQYYKEHEHNEKSKNKTRRKKK